MSGLTQAALGLMGGSATAAKEFVGMLPEPMRQQVPARFTMLSNFAYSRMLADPTKFMAFKVPENTVPLALERFRKLIEALFEDRVADVQQLVSSCSIDDAYVLFSSCGRIITAHKQHPLTKNTAKEPIFEQSVAELSQSNLF